MPIFILYLILKSSNTLSQENFETRCSCLYDEYGKDVYNVLYNIVFLIRRYVFAVCLIFLGSSPYMQLAINSIIAYLPLTYIVIYRPFSTKSDNILNGITEGCIFIKMTLLFILLTDLSKDREYYLDWALVICLYASFMIPLAYRVLIIVMNFINKIRGIKKTTSEIHTDNIVTNEIIQKDSSKDVLR